MRRYTTPTITLRIDNIDLTGLDVYVTFRQGCRSVTKNEDEITVSYTDSQTVIDVFLDQSETALFQVGKRCEVQVNWVASGDVRLATKTKAIKITENLLEREVDYDG